VDLGAGELELLGCPKALLLPASWRQVVGGVELMCPRVATTHQQLTETLAMLGREVLKPPGSVLRQKEEVFS
jgi:hypothetical protein